MVTRHLSQMLSQVNLNSTSVPAQHDTNFPQSILGLYFYIFFIENVLKYEYQERKVEQTVVRRYPQWLCTPPKTIVSSTEKNSIRRMQIHTFRTESSEGMVTMQTIYTYIYIYFFIMLIEKIIWVHSAHHNIYRDIILFSRSWMNCREKLAKKVEQCTDAPNVVGGKKMLPMDYPNFREKYVQPSTPTVDCLLYTSPSPRD